MYYNSIALKCQCFNAKKYQSLLKIFQSRFSEDDWATKKPLTDSVSGFDYRSYYFFTNRMPRVLGPQWLEMVQPARVT